MNLLASMRKNVSMKKENGSAAKRTQIPVKVKPQVADQKNIQKVKKKGESPSGPRYKSFACLKSALSSLDVIELSDLLEATWVQFKNDVIMLKTALTFMNEKLRLEKAEDSLFFDKPLDYPNNVLPDALRDLLQDLVSKCSHEHLKHYFHNVLQSLCDELNRSRNFIGHLIVLQQIAQYFPEVCISNLASTVILRNSYQNQPSICLSLFWALGSSGFYDTTVGLKVWKEIISSVINAKSYTKFAFDYLFKILAVSNKTPALEISLEEYKSIINLLLSNDSNSKIKLKDLPKIKAKCVEMLTTKFIKSLIDAARIESLFLFLLSRCSSHPDLFVPELVKCLETHPEESLKIWKLNFHSCNQQNVLLFNYFGELLFIDS